MLPSQVPPLLAAALCHRRLKFMSQISRRKSIRRVSWDARHKNSKVRPFEAFNVRHVFQTLGHLLARVAINFPNNVGRMLYQ